VGSAFILAGAISRIGQSREIEGLGMVIISVFGVIVNGVAVLKTRKGTGLNEKTINLHLLEDVLGWLSVLVGSVLIYLFKWYVIDSLLSIAIAGFLLFESSKNIKKIFAQNSMAFLIFLSLTFNKQFLNLITKKIILICNL
jgi:cobalt-zinc-cadmium efflux system protein